jgi:hypothetical protein
MGGWNNQQGGNNWNQNQQGGNNWNQNQFQQGGRVVDPRGHTMSQQSIPTTYSCDRCRSQRPPNEYHMRCSQCNVDYCSNCSSQMSQTGGQGGFNQGMGGGSSGGLGGLLGALLGGGSLSGLMGSQQRP